jgi:hypothetical protein
MSQEIPNRELSHAHHGTPDAIRITLDSSSDSLRGASSGGQGTTADSTIGANRALRHHDTTTDAPDFTTIGELTDDALDIIAALLVDDYLRSQSPSTDATADDGFNQWHKEK